MPLWRRSWPAGGCSPRSRRCGSLRRSSRSSAVGPISSCSSPHMMHNSSAAVIEPKPGVALSSSLRVLHMFCYLLGSPDIKPVSGLVAEKIECLLMDGWTSLSDV